MNTKRDKKTARGSSEKTCKDIGEMKDRFTAEARHGGQARRTQRNPSMNTEGSEKGRGHGEPAYLSHLR